MLKFVGHQLRQQTRQLMRSALLAAPHSGSGAKEQQQTETDSSLTAVEEAINGWDKKLESAGVGDIDFNIKCLVSHVLGRKFATLRSYAGVHFDAAQLQDFERLCEARCARMPLQYILGEWDFMDLTLKTAPTVFIPRPETEEFVRRVIEVYRDAPQLRMLEVGCGSGAISLAILNALPQVLSTAIERSRVATALAWENAKMLQLHERFEVHNHTMSEEASLPSELAAQRYDLIVSNPPYVKSDEFQHLQPEVVVYENLNALNGGQDGLNVARLVFELADRHLRLGGKLWMELGEDHPQLVQTIMDTRYEGRLRFVSGYKDQYERERFVEIEKV